MNRYKDIFATGKHFNAFLLEGLESEKASAIEFANKARSTGTFAAPTLERLSQIRGKYHLLVAAEIWCPDCHINVAVMDFMCEAQPKIDLAIVSKGRAENDLQDSLGLDSILVPVVAILDEGYNLIGTFVERPKVLLNDTTGQAMLRYRAGNHMDDTLQDLLEVMEQHERNQDMQGK
ncbi:thioredoxin family protein [Stutzerimonas kunmingensis]|uniref:thioredoxin family protein n=1 Tax=Stutzerimonas kunmingensis TaxID=1211807 RepID=UPI0028AF61B0|nr:thioredoxin family protein [Stutzerimonas kunmingensis]